MSTPPLHQQQDTTLAFVRHELTGRHTMSSNSNRRARHTSNGNSPPRKSLTKNCRRSNPGSCQWILTTTMMKTSTPKSHLESWHASISSQELFLGAAAKVRQQVTAPMDPIWNARERPWVMSFFHHVDVPPFKAAPIRARGD